jgi:hypothetical protein
VATYIKLNVLIIGTDSSTFFTTTSWTVKPHGRCCFPVPSSPFLEYIYDVLTLKYLTAGVELQRVSIKSYDQVRTQGGGGGLPDCNP